MVTRLAVISRSLGPRLLQGALAAAVVGIPFGLLLALVRSSWAPLAELDLRVTSAVTAWTRERPAVKELLDVIAVVFSPNMFYALAAITAVWLWIRERRRIAAWVAVTTATGSLLGVTLKVIVERSRPLVDEPIAHAGGYSFPSGHALNSFVGCAVLLLTFLPLLHGWRRLLAWMTAIAVPVITAFDRVALGVHYLSDVTASWALGTATVVGTTIGFRVWRDEHGMRRQKPTEGVEPELSPAVPGRPSVEIRRSG